MMQTSIALDDEDHDRLLQVFKRRFPNLPGPIKWSREESLCNLMRTLMLEGIDRELGPKPKREVTI